MSKDASSSTDITAKEETMIDSDTKLFLLLALMWIVTVLLFQLVGWNFATDALNIVKDVGEGVTEVAGIDGELATDISSNSWGFTHTTYAFIALIGSIFAMVGETAVAFLLKSLFAPD